MMTPLMALISWRLCQQPSSPSAPDLSRRRSTSNGAQSPSSAITPSTKAKTMPTSPMLQWAFDFCKTASRLYLASSSSWWILPVVSRVNDSRSNIKPTTTLNNMSIGRNIKRADRQERIMERKPIFTEDKDQSNGTLSRHVSDGSIVTTDSGINRRELAEEIVHPSPLTRRLPWFGRTFAVTQPKIVKKVSQDESEISLMPIFIDLQPRKLQQQQLEEQKDNNDRQGQQTLRRVSSQDWIRDYKGERIDKINFNNVFGGIGDAAFNEIPTLPPLTEYPSDKYSETVHKKSPKRREVISSPTSPVSATTVAADSEPPLSPTPLISIDEPNPNDVICGRGGRANSHPGNICFREEALKLRSWYESSSKSEKFTISSLLVDFVRERGGRFLKRDGDRPGYWLEADSNDVRKKASQALREGRLKEVTSKAANSGV